MTSGAVTGPELGAFIAAQFEAELQLFRAALAAVPAEQFGVARLGHSAAWHALHIADWLRLTVLEDRTPDYHHLGWEDRDWVKTLDRAPAPLDETAGKDAILARLDRMAGRAVAAIRAMTPADLAGTTFAPSAPTGERPRLPSLGIHLRHIAYHRGQLRLVLKTLGG